MTGNRLSLEQLLECAITASWQQLLPDKMPVLIHAEYHPGGDAPLEFVKIWCSSERGYWRLVCDYWPHHLSARPIGPTFSDGYQSDRLTKAFEMLSRDPDRFSRLGTDSRDGFLLLQDVTVEQCAGAQKMLSEQLSLPSDAVFNVASKGTYADA